MLADVEPASAVATARVELMGELLDDLRRVDRQLAESKKRLKEVVAASGTTTIGILGVGPVWPPPSSASPVTSPASHT